MENNNRSTLLFLGRPRGGMVYLTRMSFTETKIPFGPYTKVSVCHKETGNEITIIPEMGARLNHFQVNLHGDSVDIIDGYTDAHALSLGTLTKNAPLAPFPNRVADGKYHFGGHEHQLAINRPHEHNAIHGFVFNREFTLESTGKVEDFYELTLRSLIEAEEGFPWPFTMVIKYRFGGVWLEIDTEIINTGKHYMPVGFGWHPYFRTSGGIDHLRLTLPEVERLVIDDRKLPTGEKETFDTFSAAHPIGATEFDSGFQMVGAEREVQLFDETLGLYITLTMPEADVRYDYLQVYTAPNRESIALEPMTCAPNAFNNGMGLKKLASGESLRSHFTILVS